MIKTINIEVKDRLLFEQHCLFLLTKLHKYVVFINKNNPEKENFIAFSNIKTHHINLPQFGFISYDYKKHVEPHLVTKNKKKGFSFPDFFFFQPSILIKTVSNKAEITYLDTDENSKWITCLIHKKELPISLPKNKKIITLYHNKALYFKHLSTIKQAIEQGQVYEVNYCQEFYSKSSVDIDPIANYFRINTSSPDPNGCFIKYKDLYALCASPERFLEKKGNLLTSQPIKGTIKKDKHPEKDKANIHALTNSQKDIAENIMIVDLVRNDLSRICKPGSVTVSELCKVYTFSQVHQMISTIQGVLTKEFKLKQILSATFPMGSMTGAPKISAMNIIEQLEPFKRNLYSGSAGYIDTHNNFDLNVMIRTVFYNKKQKKLAIYAGGAITDKSIIQEEYEESLLKIKALQNILNQ